MSLSLPRAAASREEKKKYFLLPGGGLRENNHGVRIQGHSRERGNGDHICRDSKGRILRSWSFLRVGNGQCGAISIRSRGSFLFHCQRRRLDRCRSSFRNRFNIFENLFLEGEGIRSPCSSRKRAGSIESV